MSAPQTEPALKYAAVEKALHSQPWTFQFFQAVRLLAKARPQAAMVGKFVQPSREVVRFGAHASVAFPASEIQNILWDGPRPLFIVNFMGLTGPMGVLPLYYSELIMERLRAKDYALASFLDIFNHRMVSLFYQAWEKYRFTVSYERAERDRFSRYLLNLIGLGGDRLRDRQAVADDSLLFYAGLFALQPRSAGALRQILEDYFEVPVGIEQFVGEWQQLSIPDRCRLDHGGFSGQLGAGAVAGDEIWDQQSGVRIRLGPLTMTQYRDFLPGGSAYAPLRALARFFAGPEIQYQVQLVLRRHEVPACELAGNPMLGWYTWLTTQPIGRDPGDTILRI